MTNFKPDAMLTLRINGNMESSPQKHDALNYDILISDKTQRKHIDQLLPYTGVVQKSKMDLPELSDTVPNSIQESKSEQPNTSSAETCEVIEFSATNKSITGKSWPDVKAEQPGTSALILRRST
ncbi:hypothetical protein QE152_g8428 [Popillia japonica]|uniref:Uncharacterized protein n=1 Tax=Popillia japonica TaxID=7064 RepID=A0AAW1M8W0_POPJA